MPLALEIVSPEKLLISTDVDMVVIPGAEGELGVLPGHAPLITLLRGGVVALYEGERVTERYFVARGFAEVTPEHCTILADIALPVGSIVRSEAEKQLADALATLQAVEPDDMTAMERAMEQVQSAQAMVDAVGAGV